MDLFLTVLLSAGILVVGFGLIYLITYLLRRWNLFGHTAQFFISVFAFILILLFAYVGFGESSVRYIMSGLFIGIGLSLQPLMKTITKGFVFDGTRLSKYDGDVEIVGKSVRGKVHTVGMLHTWILDNEGNYYMVANDMLSQNVLKVYPKKREEPLPKKTQYQRLATRF
tara:strand:- start:4435 stop:4941 length:507 start_codon:yes stop_codon:yes gene_type:complete